MRSSILCLALAGLSGFAQAMPTTDTTQLQSEPRGLITRGLTHKFYPRQASTPTEPPPTRRQAATPPPPLTSAPPAGGGPINNANRTITLTVIKGDTLGQIARLFNSGICDIAKLNNIPNPDFIDVNQVLQVPVNVGNPDNASCLKSGGAIPPAGGGPIPNANRTITLTVIKGDTLGQLARLFNSGICDIAKLNNIPDPDFIDVNQVLQVPINLANPDNASCLKSGGSGGAIPPAAAPAAGTATRRRRRNASLPAVLPASHEQPSH